MKAYSKFIVAALGFAAWLGAIALGVEPKLAGTVVLTLVAGGVYGVPNRD